MKSVSITTPESGLERDDKGTLLFSCFGNLATFPSRRSVGFASPPCDGFALIVSLKPRHCAARRHEKIYDKLRIFRYVN